MLRVQAFMLTATLVSYGACTSDDPEPAPKTPIRSAEELSTYLRTAHDSPLDRLAPDARERFLDGLVFGEHELGGFRYTELQALPPADVYRILSLFGAERTAPMVLRGHVPSEAERLAPRMRKPEGEDHEHYYCASPHNCFTTTGAICMTGC